MYYSKWPLFINKIFVATYQTNNCNIIYQCLDDYYSSFTKKLDEVNHISWLNNFTNGGMCEYIPHSMYVYINYIYIYIYIYNIYICTLVKYAYKVLNIPVYMYMMQMNVMTQVHTQQFQCPFVAEPMQFKIWSEATDQFLE